MSESEANGIRVERQHDWTLTRPSVAVVEALAEVESVGPNDPADELDTTLHDHVDADALDALLTGDGAVTVALTVDDYRVRIDGDRLTVGREDAASEYV